MTTSNETKTIIFPKGMTWIKKGDKAPENLRGKIAIKVDQFIQFLNDMDEYRSDNGWINFGLWKSKKTGELYLSLDTYKPKPKEEVKELDF